MSSAAVANNAAHVQAELMEKEKHIIEQQNRTQQIKNQLGFIANQQTALEKEKRRALLTLSELEKLGENRVVYRSVGRMFAKKPVPSLRSEFTERSEQIAAEIVRIVEEKKRISELVTREEHQLQTLVNEFMNFVQLVQATAPPQRSK